MDNQSSLSFEAGEMVYKIDADSNEAYIITEGEVNLYSRDGFLLASLSDGEMFGETSVIMGEKRSITAKAGLTGLKVISQTSYKKTPYLELCGKKHSYV